MITPKTKFSASLTASGLIIAALLFVLIFPLGRSIQQHSTDVYQDRIKAEIAAGQQRSARSSRVEYDQLKTKAAELQQFFVSETNVLEFISSLESAAGNAGVNQAIANLSAPEKGAQDSTIQITVSGPYPAIIAYLNNVEQLPYYLTITRVTFAASGSANTVQAAFQAQIFWL